jgi:hypothetical protein
METEINNYIKNSSFISIEYFISNHKQYFEDHCFESKETLRSHILKIFKKYIKLHKKDQYELTCNSELWLFLFRYNQVTNYYINLCKYYELILIPLLLED